jgi:methylenetetrahydrofolate--tRNA-(uracil-5-)-methyltransferase
VGNVATGLVAGINAAHAMQGQALIELPPTTMLGALCHYISHADAKDFQPMKAAFGILPPLENPPRDKRARAKLYAERAIQDMQVFLAATDDVLLHARAESSAARLADVQNG